MAACDGADRAAVAALLGQVPAAHPLTAVIHAAGVPDEGVIPGLSPEQVRTVLRPKADAAIALDELTAGLDLSAFVLFSSVAATFGTPGRGSQAAADAVLDALAEDRRARGLPAVSIAWSAAEPGPELYDAALAAEVPVVVAADLDLAGLRAQAEAGTLPPLWRGLVRLPDAGQSAAAEGPELLAQLAGLAEAEQQELVLRVVREQAAAVLGYPSADPVRAGSAFRDLGFDSLTAVELRNRLAGVTGLRLPATLAFDHPTPQVLAAWLHGEISQGETGLTPSSPALAGLEGIERLLLSGYAGDEESDQVAARMEAILSRWKAFRKPAADAGESVERKLEEATDDEVFEFLGEEFGISLSRTKCRRSE
jgi:acyl carrier protein